MLFRSLRLVRQPDDDLAFERIINVPKRGIGQTTVQRVLSFARMNQISAMRAVALLVGSDELPAAARKKLVAFQAMIEQWRELMNTTEHTELAEQISKVRARLADAVEALEATGVETLRFADAEHGFAHDSSRPSHRAEDAATAFDRSRAWLAG